ncbi:hypothetical protein EBT23_01050 [bacterium]|nr:hypothetical protein [bacterium]
MIRPLVVAFCWPLASLAQLFTSDDPRDTATPLLAGKSLYDWSVPRDSIFWKADSDGNEWRKDSYGTIWKKEAGQDPFKKESWTIDGYDFRQARRISTDTIMQFQLNLDGSIKTETIRQVTLVYPSDPSPSTLPAHLRKAEFQGDRQVPTELKRQLPLVAIPTKPPK